MALQKQNISISFSQGIDTKTDPRQVVAGKLEALNNSVFTEGMALEKRNGQQTITTTAEGVGRGISAYGSEIISFDDYNLYSYVPEGLNNLSKGISQPIDVQSQFVYQPSSNFVSQVIGLLDSAMHSSGYTIYTFVDPDDGQHGSFVITSSLTNQIVIKKTLIASSTGGGTAGYKCFVIGNFFIVSYYNFDNLSLEYVPIPISTLTAGAAVVVGALDSSTQQYDAVTANSLLVFAYGATNKVQLKTLSSSLVLSSAHDFTDGTQPHAINMWIDEATPANIWIAYYTGSVLKYLIVESTGFTATLAITTIGSFTAVNRFIGTITGAAAISILYVEQQTTYSNGALANSISSLTLTNAGVIGATRFQLYNGSLLSRAFKAHRDNNYVYFVLTYGSNVVMQTTEPTYFIMRHHIGNGNLNNADNLITPIAKLASGGAFPYQENDSLSIDQEYYVTHVTMVGDNKATFAILKANGGLEVQGVLFPNFCIATQTIDFANNDAYQYAEIGNVLNITGGLLGMYDGGYPVENNFNVYPENINITSSTSGGSLAAADYAYIAVYRWTDSKGNTHRSAPSIQFEKTTTGATSTNTIKVPTLQYTQKQNGSVVVELYRNTPTAPAGNSTTTFYIILSAIQDSNTKEVTFTDTFADADIVGDTILYTQAGGGVDNAGPPPCAGITIYKSRLFIIDAEDRNLLWFSKQVIEDTPVEMSALFTQFIDPRFGPMTAISVLDDKLIIFKSNAIFYLTGQGPDNAGGNNDFSDAIYVTSNVGCVDPRSIVTTQDGLMFKSNKGIWLLDRGLGTSYIGAPLEKYNPHHITGAELIPDTTQVQFTLDDNTTCLMYDYFYKQWDTFSNYVAAATTVYNGLFTFITPTGTVISEIEGTYSDSGTAILQSLTTSWLSFAGLQGFQRVYRLYLLTEYLSPQIISVGIAYDFDDTIVQTITMDSTSLSQIFGPLGQWRINIDKQKCQAIKITISEQIDPNNPTPGAGLKINAIGLLVGSKLSYPKLIATQSVTS